MVNCERRQCAAKGNCKAAMKDGTMDSPVNTLTHFRANPISTIKFGLTQKTLELSPAEQFPPRS